MTPFGEFLESLRRSRKLRQKQLAFHMGISAAYVSAIETGHKGPPSDDVLENLVAELCLSSNEQEELWKSARESELTLKLPPNLPPNEYRLFNRLRGVVGKMSEDQMQALQGVLNLIERTGRGATR